MRLLESLFRVALAGVAALLLLPGPSFAAVDADSAERERIPQERAAAQARFVARDAECRRRFVVSSCVEEARRERRETLDELRSRQLAVDEARRRARTEARRVELAAKAAEDARRDAERSSQAAAASGVPAASAARIGRPLEPRRATPPPAAASGVLPRDVKRTRPAPRPKPARRDPAALRAEEAAHRAAFEAKQEEAARHREEVLDAATRRMLRRRPAASLPTPSAPMAKGASAP